jgi:hypothetical protein
VKSNIGVVGEWYQSGIRVGLEWEGSGVPRVKMLREQDVPSRCVWRNQYDVRG